MTAVAVAAEGLAEAAQHVLLLGGIIAAQSDGLRQMGALWTALSEGQSLDGAMQAARLVQLLAAVAFSGVLFLLLSRSGATAFALVIEGAALIGGYAMRPEMSLAAAIPGVAAALCAFALSGGLPRDAGAWRILVPVGLSMALAFALTPQSGTTWSPLEELAQRVRSAFEDYFRFTEERIPFALSSEGYDHAAEVDGGVVARLGGPATPDSDPVMRVTADAPVLLRGSIRRTYTGHTWVDSDAKARYLFYDFTRKRVREDVFGMTGNDWMPAVNVSVSLMTGGTSTLFVPGRMASFDMDYNTAVYYNSIGEMFLARPVEDGDAYSLVGCAAPDEDALRAAVERMRDAEDADYASIVDSCTQLPSGIENGVYALTTNSLTAERIVQNRSYRVDPKLKAEDLTDAVTASYDGSYLIFAGGHVYGLDGRQPKSYPARNDTAFLYECFYWEGVPARSVMRMMDGVAESLWFGTADGRICRFNTDIDGMKRYSDDGAAITALWSTKADDDGDPMVLKTMLKKGNAVTIKPYTRSSVKILFRTDRDAVAWQAAEGTMDIFDWEDIDFARFTFNANDGPAEVPFNRKVKNYKRLQIIVKNDAVNEGFGVFSIVKHFVTGNFAKK